MKPSSESWRSQQCGGCQPEGAPRIPNQCEAFATQSQKELLVVRGWVVEPRGIEPLTSAVRLQRSPI
jgi:hypothetical protein